ncbi:MAG: hypothetical protein WDN76_06450 [Alphaproteobacteria bacterium]
MSGGPKLNAFMAACGALAAGLGVVGASLPFLSPKDKPAAVSAAPPPKEETLRACTDAEKEVVRAALNNYGRRAVEECYHFSKDRSADVNSCDVDLVSRRINARGQYKWVGGIRKDDQNFNAAFSTDFSGTELRMNILSRSRDSDAKCETLDRNTR